jgi:hypothetical protein
MLSEIEENINEYDIDDISDLDERILTDILSKRGYDRRGVDVKKIKDYQNNWEKQKSSYSTNLKEWQSVDDEIKQAITKRTIIDEKKFLELKYYDFKWLKTQQTFINTVFNISDSTKVKLVADKLGNVSALTLTQIADSITNILQETANKTNERSSEFPLKKDSKGENVRNLQHALNTIYNLTLTVDGDFGTSCVNALRDNGLPEEITEEKLNELIQQIPKPPQPQEQQPAMPPAQQQSATTDKTSEIIQYIKGSELDETKLQEYKKTKGISQNLKKSIQLCLDFWALDGSVSGEKKKTYWTLHEKVNEEKVKTTFENSKVKAFLDKIYNEEKPSYSKQDKKKGLK